MGTQCCTQASLPRTPVVDVAWDLVQKGHDDDGPDYTCTMYSKAHKTKKKAGSYAGKAVPNEPIGGKDNLWPSWPAGSPWVTAVGATRFVDDRVAALAPQAAVAAEDGFGSGGGFSWNFDRPDYQKAAVEGYLKAAAADLPKEPAAWNEKGRATPDVSALGTGYELLVDGQPMPGVGGTSASAPVFAAMVSRINEERLAAKQAPLGFLNPFLYANAGAFTDVTLGDDKVGRGGDPLPYGFVAAKGWDPVTGLGTPNYPKLLEAAKKAAAA